MREGNDFSPKTLWKNRFHFLTDWSGHGKRPKSCLRVMVCTFLHSAAACNYLVHRATLLRGCERGRKKYFFYHQPWKMQININRQKVSRYFNSNLTISADLHWIHWNACKTPLRGCTIYWVRVLGRNSIGDFLGEGVLETIVGLEIVLCLFNLLHNVICLVNAANRNIEKLPRNVLILSNPVVGHRQI